MGTQDHDADEAQRRNADLLRASFVQAAVGMAISAPDGRLLEVNRRTCDILGYSERELKAMTAFDFAHPDDVGNTRSDVGRLLDGEISHYARERRYIRKDGSDIWCLTSVSLLRDDAGRPYRFVSVLEDITLRKQAEAENARLYEEARKARAEAERLGELKDEFLATLSHELRTPLSAILGWTQVLRRRPVEGPELQKALETIERNARVQTQLIEDLLDMSRITSGKMRLDIQPVDPAAFIEAALATVAPGAEAKGVRLDKALDRAAGPIWGDPARLQQVVWNLLSNAIKFTPRDGRIRVALQRAGSHAEISVADTGIGIKPAFLAHVFERFRQADASTTREHGGLGLGLSIVRHLVELQGGSVRVHSEGEGKGATFVVNLPLAAVHRPGTPEGIHPRTLGDSQDYRLADLTGLRFLVVDDEEDARALVQRVLADCGAEVRGAAGAQEALAALAAFRPQVLLCDIGMPGVDGYELLRRVRNLPDPALARTPAVALTAFARSEDRTRALRAGFLVHLSKPVEPAELVATAASVAGR
jgi:PAS domain S-box-containing protein